ncbi:Oidioi.mRNA.OKI2018_I69.XSR.g15430.t2.cds [Oikopleura dioica]|nr:Oidioi.mRNA.OKI2018_I69.XSR.g15430.t2.cds [Oikopleura dioica]
MKAEKEEQSKSKNDPKNRKSKYMESVMKTYQKRELLRARREERKAHKERAEEKDEFADKEQFITNAYREKLKEMKEAEEEEARMDKIEEIMDVTKQKDMSGFYKHFLNRQVNNRNIRQKKKEEESEEENTDDDEPVVERLERDKPEVKEEVNDESIKVENSNNAAASPVKHENNQDADSDFLSEDEEKPDVKNEQSEADVKTDLDVKLEGDEYAGRRKSETLVEFKQRLKKKKERSLDIYRTKHTEETLAPFRQRYLERRDKKRQEGRYI